MPRRRRGTRDVNAGRIKTMYPMRKKSMTLTFVRLRTKPEIKRRLFIFFSSFSAAADCGLTFYMSDIEYIKSLML